MRDLFRRLWQRNLIQFGVLYLGASWLLLQVATTVEGAANLPDWVDTTALVFLAIGFPIVLILAWAQQANSSTVDGTSASSIVTNDDGAIPDKPSLAVLPFRVLSSQEEHRYLAEGLSEDLSMALSHLPDILVIDYRSAATHAGDTNDVRKIGQALGASYLVSGSLRRTKNLIRITASLSDARSALQLWSGKYDQAVEAFFDIQDEIVDEICRLVADQSLNIEDHRIRTKHPENLNAYEALRRAWDETGHVSHDKYKDAIRLTLKAIELDENYAHAHCYLSQILNYGVTVGFSDDPIKDLETAKEHHKIAQGLAPDDLYVLSSLGNTAIVQRRYDDAIQYAHKALSINHNYASAHFLAGVALTYGPEPWKAIEEIETAEKFSPKNTSRMFWSYARGVAHYVIGNYDQAEEAIRDAIARGLGEFWPAWFSLCYVLEAQGKREQAVDALQSSVKFAPESSMDGFEKLVHGYFDKRPRHDEVLATLRVLWPLAFA